MTHPIVNIAVRAARRGGHVLLRNLERLADLQVTVKGKADFVSEVDRRAEQAIIEAIHASYPSHAVLAEESGEHAGDDFCWIIDPLDGTANYLHGFPHFCISIAVTHRGRIEHAVVYDPLREELFAATRGAGAMLNSHRIRASHTDKFNAAVIATGHPPRHADGLDGHVAAYAALAGETALRRTGSAALDLAYVAGGRLDGFWEIGLKAWDMAAGALLVREAGGMVAAPDGSDRFLEQGAIVAANPRLFKSLMKIVHAGAARAARASLDRRTAS